MFIRLARRNGRNLPGDSFLRNVLIEDVTGTALSSTGCSITGLEDMRPEHITLRNVNLKMRNGDAQPVSPFPELPQKGLYVGMWRSAMPAYGLYMRHADGVKLENVFLKDGKPGGRPVFLAEDCNGTEIAGGDLRQ